LFLKAMLTQSVHSIMGATEIFRNFSISRGGR
jgi:hypothetical protein